MKITRRNAVLCVMIWVVFVLSLPIYALWVVFNYKHLYSWTEKFCDFIDRLIIQKQWKQWKQWKQRKKK